MGGRALPKLKAAEVLKWADAHRARFGDWPMGHSTMRIVHPRAARETWRTVNYALQHHGCDKRGIRSLAQLLERFRGRRNLSRLPRLTVTQVLAWADQHRARIGRWPTAKTPGAIPGGDGITWKHVDSYLRVGGRGLPGTLTLTRFLEKHRGARNLLHLPPLEPANILKWADAHRERTGRWPGIFSGPVPEAPEETWGTIDHALRHNKRGLKSRGGLRWFLAKHGRLTFKRPGRPLNIDQIIACAKSHQQRTGRWPRVASGKVRELPGDTWKRIDSLLRRGGRELPGRQSLVQLLSEHCGARVQYHAPDLSLSNVRVWLRRHRERTGKWPGHESGAIPEARDETWRSVINAMNRGRRGLPRGATIDGWPKRRCGLPARSRGILLSESRIVAWARAHFARTGHWPRTTSGTVREEPSITWAFINQYLDAGGHGLAPGSSLARLLNERLGARHRLQPPD